MLLLLTSLSLTHPLIVVGPCRNDRLITYDYKTKKWIARSSLVASTKSASGNYSLVSPAVWEVFKEHYRGSGPEIKYCYQQEHHYHQQQHNDHNKHVVFTDDDEDDENVGYPPHYWDIRQDQCNYEDLVIRQDVEDVVDKEKSDIVVDQEHKRSHHDHEYKHNNYYEQHEDEKSTTSCTHSSITNDIDLVLDSGDDDINNNKNNKKRSHHHHKQHKTYEKMFDRTITKEDRSNILSFFGTRGENLDFHIRSNEKINEKYLHGLGTPEEKQDEDSEVTIKVSVTTRSSSLLLLIYSLVVVCL